MWTKTSLQYSKTHPEIYFQSEKIYTIYSTPVKQQSLKNEMILFLLLWKKSLASILNLNICNIIIKFKNRFNVRFCFQKCTFDMAVANNVQV